MFSEDGFLTEMSRTSIELFIKLRVQQQAFLSDQQNVLNLVDLLENVQKKWRNAEIDNSRLRESNERLKRQNENYEVALNETTEENRRLRAHQAADRKLIEALREELDQYKIRFSEAKAQIQNATLVLPPIREATNSDTDTISTESRTGKRRSNSLGVLPDKRSKWLMEVDLDRLAEEDNDDDVETPPVVSRQRTMNRSMSESRIFEDKKEMAKQEQKPMSSKFPTTSTMDMRLLSPMVGFGSGWTRGRPVEQCGHSFTQHNNLFSAAFSYCGVCARGLGMRGLKCNDCKLQIHENCRQHAPIPCVPMIPTPQRNNPKQRVRLADLCPESQPKIPGQLIRSVVALERGFINVVGLYRVPGCDSEVKKLKENFNSKYAPKLDQLDAETITGFIKKFLRDLREPLIPLSSFKEFANAVTSKDEASLKYAIETLPIPNRDTLAFLCAHWQKVAMRSNENQMPLENLAKVLGPTVVGTASKLTHLQPTPGSGGPSQADRYYMEATKQNEILLTLLKMDHHYWTAFYNCPEQSQQQQQLAGCSSAGNTPVGTPRGTTLIRRQPALASSRGRGAGAMA